MGVTDAQAHLCVPFWNIIADSEASGQVRLSKIIDYLYDNTLTPTLSHVENGVKPENRACRISLKDIDRRLEPPFEKVVSYIVVGTVLDWRPQ
jgi:hypothetical protein